MKKATLLLLIALATLGLRAQSRVFDLGNAVLKCRTFAEAENLLLQKGFTIAAAEEDDVAAANGMCINYQHGAPDADGSLRATLYRTNHEPRQVQRLVFRCTPTTTEQGALVEALEKAGYRDKSELDTPYQNLFTTADGRNCAVDIDILEEWMVTFFKGEPIVDLNEMFLIVEDGVDLNSMDLSPLLRTASRRRLLPRRGLRMLAPTTSWGRHGRVGR